MHNILSIYTTTNHTLKPQNILLPRKPKQTGFLAGRKTTFFAYKKTSGPPELSLWLQ